MTLRRSKTDQEAEGRKLGIPYGSNPETCPVRVLQAWIEAAPVTSGPLFRGVNRHGQLQAERLTPLTVARIVKKLAAAAGLEPPSTPAIRCGPDTPPQQPQRAHPNARSCGKRGTG